MELINQLKTDAQQALKAGNQVRVRVLRYLISLLEKEAVRQGEGFDQVAALTVLQKEMKQKQEALKIFQQAGRQDLVAEQEEEIKILAQYLPQMMSREEIEVIVRQLIQTENLVDFGQIMKRVMSKLKGKAEGQLVAEVVRQLLA